MPKRSAAKHVMRKNLHALKCLSPKKGTDPFSFDIEKAVVILCDFAPPMNTRTRRNCKPMLARLSQYPSKKGQTLFRLTLKRQLSFCATLRRREYANETKPQTHVCQIKPISQQKGTDTFSFDIEKAVVILCDFAPPMNTRTRRNCKPMFTRLSQYPSKKGQTLFRLTLKRQLSFCATLHRR
jgi:uncharacterized protein involved in type VI secretion and phage assembly